MDVSSASKATSRKHFRSSLLVLVLDLLLWILTIPGCSGQALRPLAATNTPGHPFCVRAPVPFTPKLEIFNMTVDTGFVGGYRSNQSVRVDIQALFERFWRIKQVFISVPETDDSVQRVVGNEVVLPRQKRVGIWSWSSRGAGGMVPVDCGGNPHSQVFGFNADAAMEIENKAGYSQVTAFWSPPRDFPNIIYRRMISFEAFVTFEDGKPTYTSPLATYTPTEPQARFVLLRSANYMNLDFWDIQEYMQKVRGPMQLLARFVSAAKA